MRTAKAFSQQRTRQRRNRPSAASPLHLLHSNRWLFLLLSVLFLHHVEGFAAHSTSRQNNNNPLEEEQFAVDVTADCSDHIIELAAEFLVDAFWLGNPRQWVQQKTDGYNSLSNNSNGYNYQSTVIKPSSYSRTRLIQRQINEFSTKFGNDAERRFKSCFVWASSDNVPLGCLAMNILLLDRSTGNVISPERSEEIMEEAFSALRPARQKLYQLASIQTLVKDVLDARDKDQSWEVVCYVSNVAVTPTARRRGVATQLCASAEQVALESGFSSLYLKVEADNLPARKLYEEKLDYQLEFTVKRDRTMRLNVQKGQIVPQRVDSYILKKELEEET